MAVTAIATRTDSSFSDYFGTSEFAQSVVLNRAPSVTSGSSYSIIAPSSSASDENRSLLFAAVSANSIELIDADLGQGPVTLTIRA